MTSRCSILEPGQFRFCTGAGLLGHWVPRRFAAVVRCGISQKQMESEYIKYTKQNAGENMWFTSLIGVYDGLWTKYRETEHVVNRSQCSIAIFCLSKIISNVLSACMTGACGR
jgi:hypothetical protein